MQLKWAGAKVLLESPSDFKSFKIVIAVNRNESSKKAEAFAGIARFDGDQIAWVSENALRNWPAYVSNAEWQHGLDKMIAKARMYGWVDDSAHAVRAHVVYESDTTHSGISEG